jgi:fucose 4-O-acetylase-like acetyltransferase
VRLGIIRIPKQVKNSFRWVERIGRTRMDKVRAGTDEVARGQGNDIPQPRDESADVLRGVGLVTVILMHSFAIVTSPTAVAQLALSASSGLECFIKALNPARMPAMMFIAGYFASLSLSRASMDTFLKKKARGVLYPFALWSALYLLIKCAISGAHGSLDSDTFWSHVLLPAGHMWFVGYLFVYFVLLAALWKRRHVLLVGAVIGLVLARLNGWDDLNRGLFLLCFFAVGSTMRPVTMHRVHEISFRWKLVSCATLFVLVALVANSGLYEVPEDYYLPESLLTSAAAVASMMLLASIIANLGGWLSRTLALVGTLSLQVYLMHWMVINMLCIAIPDVLRRLPGDVIVLAVFAASTALTTTAARAVGHFGLQWLFALPRGGKRHEGRGYVA